MFIFPFPFAFTIVQAFFSLDQIYGLRKSMKIITMVCLKFEASPIGALSVTGAVLNNCRALGVIHLNVR